MPQNARRPVPPTTADRVGAAAGAVYVLLILVGNQLGSGGTVDPHPTGDQDLATFAASPSAAQQAGFTLELTGFLAFLVFIGWLAHALRRRGGAAGWLGGVAGAAGVVTIAVKLSSVTPMVAGRLDHGAISPSTAQVLADMNSAAFVVSFLTFGTFLVGAGAAVLASGLLGKGAGWTALVIGAVQVLATLGSQLDPTRLFVPPFLAGLVWTLVVSVRLTWKGERRQVEEPVSVHVPLAV